MAEEELVEQQELFEHHRFKVDPGQTMVRIDKFLLPGWKIHPAQESRMQPMQEIFL